MATVKLVIIKSRPQLSGECMIFLQIATTGKSMRIKTDITVNPEHWEGEKILGGKKGDPHAGFKNTQLVALKNSCDIKLINNPRTKKMSLQSLKSFLLGDMSSKNEFYAYTTAIIQEYQNLGKVQSARIMSAARDKVMMYHVVQDMNEIDSKWLEKFDNHCLKDMSVNGVAAYMRYLRIILNRALNDGLIDNYPFRKFKITTEKTLNRNLSIETIRAIKNYRSSVPQHQITVDVFMLQFYLLGINIKDLFLMKKSNVKGGRLQFNRAKTDRLYNILITPEARSIIKKYEGKEYLLRFAESAKRSKVRHAREKILQWGNYDSFRKMMNWSLEEIYKALYPKREKITGYYVRHSVATILRELKVSKDDISLVMGHSSPNKITEIYINEDFAEIDKAQRKLIEYLNKNAMVDLKEFAFSLN